MGAATLEGWTRWYQLIATASCVSRSLRSALQGPGAGSLWECAVLSPDHPGLTPRQSRGLNALVAAHGHHAASLELHGGGWDVAELQRLLSCLTRLDLQVTLLQIEDPGEASIISRFLPQQPVYSVDLQGTAACLLPVSARRVGVYAAAAQVHAAGLQAPETQAQLQRFLGCLRPLSGLQDLTLGLLFWKITPADVHELASRHPQLRTLHLHLFITPEISNAALACLCQLSTVELSITVHTFERSDSVAALLRPLQGVVLESLTSEVYAVSPAEEALLAKCSMKQLTVRFLGERPFPRLQHPLPGAVVRYYYHADQFLGED